MSGDDWVAVGVNLRDHPRFVSFVAHLGVDDVMGVGLLVNLWSSAFKLAPDGDLSKWEPQVIGHMTGWRGDPMAVYNALRTAGLLSENDAIHDWSSWGGRLHLSRLHSAERQRNRRDSNGKSPLCSRDVTVMSSLKSRELREDSVVDTCVSTPSSSAKKPPSTPAYSSDYETWWASYGKVGNKGEAFTLYRYWTKAGAQPEDLLAAAVNYRSSFNGDATYQWQGRRFLAKRENRWIEWVKPEAKPNGNGKKLCADCLVDLTYDEQGEIHCPICGKVPT